MQEENERLENIFYDLADAIVPGFNIPSPIVKAGIFGIIYLKNKIVKESEVDFGDVREFWKASRKGELKENMQISIRGLLSKYAPLFPGDPLTKRNQFKEYRKKLDAEKETKDLDAKMSIASGQMVWRLPSHNGIRYMGLYQGIVRNSIPVFMDERTYYNFTKLFKTEDDIYSLQVELSGMLRPLSQYSFVGTKEPIYSIYLSHKNPGAYIKRTGKADYLDGDIWAWIQDSGENKIITRFLDLADFEDFENERKKLSEEVNEYKNSKLILHFDEVQPVIQMRQEITFGTLIEKLTSQ